MIVFFLILFGGRTEAKAVIELVAFLLMVVGFALGVIALFGIRKYGAKQILAPALLGMLIHGLLLSIFIPNFLAARAKARERTSSLTLPGFVVKAEASDWSLRNK